MATKIRLARGGAKKSPYYRMVVANSSSPRDGRFIERIGSYQPTLPDDHADRIKIDVERAEYWLSVGAIPTERVQRFFSKLSIAPKKVS